MLNITLRNLRLFFRDKSAVFFSLLASLIIIGLYVLFLGDVWSGSMTDIVNSRELMDNWIMAGLLAITSITTTMGAFGTMVTDKSKKISKDFYVAPIKRSSIAGGYILSAFIIGLVMSLFTLILAEIYIIAEGGKLLSPQALLKVIGLLILADFTNTSIVFFITSFFTSDAAFNTGSTIIGTLIGFLTGIYLPIGMLPAAVQWVVKVFPPSHAAALLKQTMMPELISAAGVIPAEYTAGIKETLGFVLKFGDTQVSALASIAILIGTGLLFFFLAVLNVSRKKR
jgi:multidrug/hemolysin transport system permease protein